MWTDADKDAPTAHQTTNAEIVQMVKNVGSATADSIGQDKENESDDNEVKVQEWVSSDKCIQMATDLIEACKQRNMPVPGSEAVILYISVPDIIYFNINFYLLNSVLFHCIFLEVPSFAIPFSQ